MQTIPSQCFSTPCMKLSEQTQANTSIIFVPARFAVDAIMEAADAGILLICITEGIPTLDVIKAINLLN